MHCPNCQGTQITKNGTICLGEVCYVPLSTTHNARIGCASRFVKRCGVVESKMMLSPKGMRDQKDNPCET
jgi:hypothetical protein